ALSNFFKDANLATLRELALREVAESLDRAGSARAAPQHKIIASGKVMVCLASNPPRAKTLLSRGSRTAGRLNTDWCVVYVETPNEAPHLIDAEAQRHLLANIEKAKELGAEVVRLKSPDPAGAILDFARTHGIANIIVGRSQQPWWKQVLAGSVVMRLLREGAEFDLHVIALEPAPGAPPERGDGLLGGAAPANGRGDR
ncbi:MAG: universal stress protein, partial [Myxococcales bacterium]